MVTPNNHFIPYNVWRVGIEFVINGFFKDLDWKDRDRILDVGSGPGNHTAGVIANSIPCQWSQIVGMDVNSKMVEYARANHPRQGITYIQGDIAEPNVPINYKFNKIISFYCLHWVQNHRQVACNMIQMLEIGGEALLSFIANNYLFNAYKQQAESQRWAQYTKDYKKYISPFQDSTNLSEDLGKIYQESGFEINTIEPKYLQHKFGSRDAFKDFLICVNPFVRRIPNDLQEDYINNLLQIMIEYSEKVLNYQNDEIIYDYNMVVVHLVRFDYRSITPTKLKEDQGEIIMQQ